MPTATPARSPGLVMIGDKPDSTARSELQSIGRTLDDEPRSDEANEQALQTVMPWVWLEVGIVVAFMFACLAMIGPLPAAQSTPTHSVTYDSVVRHR